MSNITKQSINNSAKVKQKQTEASVKGHSGLYTIAYACGTQKLYFRYRDPNTGKRRRIYIGNPSVTPLHQLYTLADSIRTDITNGIAPVQVNLTVSDFFDAHYLPWAKTNKLSWRDDLSRFDSHLREPIGDTQLNTLTTYQVQKVLDGMVANEYAPATRNKTLALLRKAFNLACDWEMMRCNPAAKVPLIREHNICDYVLDDDEIQSLLTAISTDNKSPLVGAVLKLQMATGLRIGEVLKLKWHNIDFSRRLITIVKPKSGVTRVIPMGDFAFEVLSQVQELALEGQHVFVSASDSSKHIVMPYRAIQRIKKSAGVERFSSHDLRRWFASTASNSGMSLHQVSRSLGHCTQAVTESRYSFLSAQSLIAVVNSVNQHLNSIN